MQNKAQKWVFAALTDITGGFPFPIIGIDSDNGSAFINSQLFRYCTEHEITFWAVVRQIVGYHRYDTAAESSSAPRAPRRSCYRDGRG